MSIRNVSPRSWIIALMLASQRLAGHLPLVQECVQPGVEYLVTLGFCRQVIRRQVAGLLEQCRAGGEFLLEPGDLGLGRLQTALQLPAVADRLALRRRLRLLTLPRPFRCCGLL